jgi:hypothetical protein
MYSDFVKLHIVICVALALPACRDRSTKQLKEVRDEVCACKTVACAETALAKVPQKNVKSTPKSQQLAREMLNCLAELYAANQPSLDPDAEGSSAP